MTDKALGPGEYSDAAAGAVKSEEAFSLARPSLSRAAPMVDPALPPAQGLYDPAYEHDSCGVGFVADLQNRKSHDILVKGLQILANLDHRGATGADANLGDG
ncbi:MAG TPA: hypothetical protein VGY52_11200, partial [Roseiarcus sp.]|nr:hypothetical protein [Roseiarcus sp.]